MYIHDQLSMQEITAISAAYADVTNYLRYCRRYRITYPTFYEQTCDSEFPATRCFHHIVVVTIYTRIECGLHAGRMCDAHVAYFETKIRETFPNFPSRKIFGANISYFTTMPLYFYRYQKEANEFYLE